VWFIGVLWGRAFSQNFQCSRKVLLCKRAHQMYQKRDFLMLQITVFVVSNLWCVEWDVKLYYAIMYHVGCSLTVALCVSNCYYCRQYIQLSVFFTCSCAFGATVTWDSSSAAVLAFAWSSTGYWKLLKNQSYENFHFSFYCCGGHVLNGECRM